MSDWNNLKAPPYDCLAFSWATEPPSGEALGALFLPLKEIEREQNQGQREPRNTKDLGQLGILVFSWFPDSARLHGFQQGMPLALQPQP